MATGEEYLDLILAELKQGHRQWKRGDNLLAAFGYMRRRQTAIDLINSELEKRGVYTLPELSVEMPLDRAIRFRLRGAPPDSPDEEPGAAARDTATETVEVATATEEETPSTVIIAAEPPAADPENPADRALIVGNLECAERSPEVISPNATVKEALTRMDLREYSQLVVTSGVRDIRGIVSYKSVARANLMGTPLLVSDCIDTTVPRVELNEPLLRVIDRFKEHDAVLVIGADKTLAGIVTPADIAMEFGAMAGPFLLIGQMEEQLRWLVQQRIDDIATALAAAATPREPTQFAAPGDLTMGELQLILQHPESWERVGIRYDRATFCKELDAVREIRNAVMHFRDTPSTVEFDRLKNFAAVVQRAYLALAK